MQHLARPLSYVALLLVLATQALPAAASNTWSDTDPIVLITTPSGQHVSIYVDNGTWGTEHLPAAQLAHMTWTAKHVGQGTMVTITSTVPCDALGIGWPTRMIPSLGPYATLYIYGSDYGICGQPMSVTFTLTTP